MSHSIQEALQILIDKVESKQAFLDELTSSLEFYKRESERLRQELNCCYSLLRKNEELFNRSHSLIVQKANK